MLSAMVGRLVDGARSTLALDFRGILGKDEQVWAKDAVAHYMGAASMAAAQGNAVMEDQCQLESGPNGTFVGVYDGHGGPDAARFACDNLFPHLVRLARLKGALDTEVIREAYAATETGFLSQVNRCPRLITVGTCALVGLLWGPTLYIANAGDSRAVLGVECEVEGHVVAEQVSEEHNAREEAVRAELQVQHPRDPDVVVMRSGVWRIKGIIQVSRSIGDAYLKIPALADVASRVRGGRLQLESAVLSAEAAVTEVRLGSRHKFVVFASDGLWEHVENQQVVEAVSRGARQGAARRLVKLALREAARKRGLQYGDLTQIQRGVRRNFHDDVSVVVLFLDSPHGPATSASSVEDECYFSVRGGLDVANTSDFSVLSDIPV